MNACKRLKQRACPLVWNKRTGNLVSGHQRLRVIDGKPYARTRHDLIEVHLRKAMAAWERTTDLSLGPTGREFAMEDIRHHCREVLRLTGGSSS